MNLLPYDLFGVVLQIKNKLSTAPQLHKVAATGDCEGIIRIIQLGFPVNFSYNRNTALHYAAALGQVEAVHLLMQLNADSKAIGTCGFTPLAMAVRAKQEDVVKILLYWKVNLKNDRFLLLSSLHNANSDSLFLLLLDSGARFYTQQDKNDALVHTCLRMFDKAVIRLLDKEGANPNTKVYGLVPLLKYLSKLDCYNPIIFRKIFDTQLLINEPLTPSPCKNQSKVQKRHLAKV